MWHMCFQWKEATIGESCQERRDDVEKSPGAAAEEEFWANTVAGRQAV